MILVGGAAKRAGATPITAAATRDFIFGNRDMGTRFGGEFVSARQMFVVMERRYRRSKYKLTGCSPMGEWAMVSMESPSPPSWSCQVSCVVSVELGGPQAIATDEFIITLLPSAERWAVVVRGEFINSDLVSWPSRE